MKGKLFLCIVGMSATLAYGQDVHLSQFYAADHLMNPARVGDHTGDYRISANYRNQWRQIGNQPLTTFVAAFDKAFHYYSHEIDGGLMVVRDQFSGFQSQTTKIFLTAAYTRTWKDNIFRAGVQSGVVSNSTDLTTQTFPEQWDYLNGTFDPSLPNMESSIRPSQLYVDVNAGGTWERMLNNVKLTGGIAVNHLNRPKDTYFSQQAERLRLRKVVHAGAVIPLGSSLNLKPQLQWMWTTRANELLLGTNLECQMGASGISKVWVGAFYRHGIVRTLDAVYPVIGASYKRFDLGFSYDINLSALSDNVQRVKSVEVSLIYTAPSSRLKYRIIPCGRY